MKCFACSTDISAETELAKDRILSSGEVNIVLRAGYNPFRTSSQLRAQVERLLAEANASGKLGLDPAVLIEDAYRGWREHAMAQTGDHVVCRDCMKDVSGYLRSYRSSKDPTLTGHSARAMRTTDYPEIWPVGEDREIGEVNRQFARLVANRTGMDSAKSAQQFAEALFILCRKYELLPGQPPEFNLATMAEVYRLLKT